MANANKTLRFRYGGGDADDDNNYIVYEPNDGTGVPIII